MRHLDLTMSFKSLLVTLAEELATKYDAESAAKETKHALLINEKQQKINELENDLATSKEIGISLLKTINNLDNENKQLKKDFDDIKSKSLKIREKFVSQIGSVLRESHQINVHKKKIQDLERQLIDSETTYQGLCDKYSQLEQQLSANTQSIITKSRLTPNSTMNDVDVAHTTEKDDVSQNEQDIVDDLQQSSYPQPTPSVDQQSLVYMTSQITSDARPSTATSTYYSVDKFLQLEQDTIIYLFSFLSTPEILRLAQTCRMLYKRVDQLFGGISANSSSDSSINNNSHNKIIHDSWEEEYKLQRFFLTSGEEITYNDGETDNAFNNAEDSNNNMVTPQKMSNATSVSSHFLPSQSSTPLTSTQTSTASTTVPPTGKFQSAHTSSSPNAITSFVSLLSSSTSTLNSLAGGSYSGISHMNLFHNPSQSKLQSPMQTHTNKTHLSSTTPNTYYDNNSANDNSIYSTDLTTNSLLLTKEISDEFSKKLNTLELKVIVNMSDTLKKQDVELATLRSEKDDLQSKLQNTETVRDFLVEKLHSAEMALKQTWKDFTVVKKQSAADQEIISFLDIRGQEMEIDTQRAKKDFDRLQTLHDLQCGQNNHTERQLQSEVDEYRARLEDQENTFKTHKKILVKEVKALRLQVEQASSERHIYRNQLQALRDALLNSSNYSTTAISYSSASASSSSLS